MISANRYKLKLPQVRGEWLSDPTLATRRPDFVATDNKSIIYRWNQQEEQVIVRITGAKVSSRHLHKPGFRLTDGSQLSYSTEVRPLRMIGSGTVWTHPSSGITASVAAIRKLQRRAGKLV